MAQASNVLGVYYANIDDDSTAIILYTQALQIAEKNNDSLGILRPYMALRVCLLKWVCTTKPWFMAWKA